jgi:hypothetical protein
MREPSRLLRRAGAEREKGEAEIDEAEAEDCVDPMPAVAQELLDPEQKPGRFDRVGNLGRIGRLAERRMVQGPSNKEKHSQKDSCSFNAAKEVWGAVNVHIYRKLRRFVISLFFLFFAMRCSASSYEIDLPTHHPAFSFGINRWAYAINPLCAFMDTGRSFHQH